MHPSMTASVTSSLLARLAELHPGEMEACNWQYGFVLDMLVARTDKSDGLVLFNLHLTGCYSQTVNHNPQMNCSQGHNVDEGLLI